jgi:hypothetical protein
MKVKQKTVNWMASGAAQWKLDETTLHDEDINTWVTIIPSIEILVPITRLRAHVTPTFCKNKNFVQIGVHIKL